MQETTMRLSAKMIATAACAVFLMPTFLLGAGEAAKPSASAKDDKATDSSSAAAADTSGALAGGAFSAASMPPASAAAAMPFAGPHSDTPKIEGFMGYSYLRAVPSLSAGNRLMWLNGGSTSVAFNFNRYLGLVGDFGGFNETRLLLTTGNPPTAVGSYDAVDAGTVFTYLAGPRLSYRKHDRITPFAQVLFGGIRASQETVCKACAPSLPTENAFALTAGGGLDIRVHHRLAIRVIQAEYMMTRFENLSIGGNDSQSDVRLSTGIVLRFGGNTAPPMPPPSPLTYSCSASPSSVFPGDAIAVSGTALNLNPTKSAIYTWSADGGTVAGTGSTAKIDTTSLAPGSYTIKGHVSEGDKPGENADCNAAYTVRAFEPPTVSCTANPVTVIAGESATITAIGVSPQNRPLTYSYSSTSGSVSGTGTTATLSTVGTAVGAVGVTCNVVDDKGQSASGTTSVMVAAPVAAAKPATSELCSIHFDRDVRRPSRIDNEGKACLDEVALDLQRNSDAHLAIVGNASGGEKGGKKLAMERAINAKAYLVSEKGIDSTRVAVYSGSQDGKAVSTTLIPAGATFDPTGDTPAR
jgi:outer membrane protein OmpA-like peptidoglycan-associated protein